MTVTIASRVEELTRSGVPFVQATVVRAEAPTSALPGDRAIILADGSMEGFVGGHCAAGSVRTAALDALASGQSLLLRVLPGGTESFPESPGAGVVVNPCHSGGALEIYLEPLLPAPVLHLTGATPVADAIASLAPDLGFVVDRAGSSAEPSMSGATAVLVADLGGDEAAAVRAALDAGVPFVGVVCSRTRGEELLRTLALSDAEAARVHPHVGVDIGARTPAEIALSTVAELVRAVRRDGLRATGDTVADRAPVTAVDPVCGMTVSVGPDTPTAVVDGVRHWFCHVGCRDRYLLDHAS